MDNKKYGYARVSAKTQKEDRQIEAISRHVVDERYIFIDKASGKDFNRRNYRLLKKQIKKGDTLIIKSVDRLGRNYDDILKQWHDITNNLQVDIQVLDMPVLNTLSQNKKLIDRFIRDIILLITAYSAEQELINIKQRQIEGISLAKLKGIPIGRPKVKQSSDFNDVFNKWANDELSTQEAMRITKLKKTTFYKYAKESLSAVKLKQKKSDAK